MFYCWLMAFGPIGADKLQNLDGGLWISFSVCRDF